MPPAADDARAITDEIKRETRAIRGYLAQARRCRQKAEACIRNGDSTGLTACLKLEREYMDAVDREMRRIDGKMRIRDILDEAAEGATEREISDAGTAEGHRELRDIHRLRQQAGDLTAEGIRLMSQGRIAQGVAKLQQATDKLAEAQEESDVVYGKLLALMALSHGH